MNLPKSIKDTVGLAQDSEEAPVANVVEFHPVTVGEGWRFDADQILEGAKGQEFSTLIIVGEQADGEVWFSSTANAGEALILLERAKRKVIFPDE